MNGTQNKIGLTGLEFRIGITMVLCLLVVLGGPARINYAIGRFLGTLAGPMADITISQSQVSTFRNQ